MINFNRGISAPLAITIIIVLAVVLVGGILAYQYYCTPKEEPEAEVGEVVKFRLIDGDTGQPIANQKILVCDDALKIKFVGEYPYYRFCDGKVRKIIREVYADASGIFLLDVKNIAVFPPIGIVFDIGETPWEWGLVDIERSDSLGHTSHSSYLRVVNMERGGHVISNKLYNLDSKEVKEIFTSDGSEKTYTFDIIDLIVFKKEQ